MTQFRPTPSFSTSRPPVSGWWNWRGVRIFTAVLGMLVVTGSLLPRLLRRADLQHGSFPPWQERNQVVPAQAADVNKREEAPASSAEDGGAILEDRRAHLVQDRQTLTRDAKLGVILLAVLFLLYREYVPMVAADYQIDYRLGEQVRSLVLLEGSLDRLNRIVNDGFTDWEGHVNERLDVALKQIIELDDYNLRLGASSPNARPELPQFVHTCADENYELHAWLEGGARRAPWEEIVTQCIIEPIDRDFESAAAGSLTDQFLVARDEVNSSLEQARLAFQLSPVEPMATETPRAGIISGPTVLTRRLSAPGGDSRQAAPLVGATTPELPATAVPAERTVLPARPVDVEQGGRAGAAAPISSAARQSRVEAPIEKTAPQLEATPAPAPVQQTFEDIEWEVNWTAYLITRRPTEAIDPVRQIWWHYAPEDRSLHAFRDNLLLDLADLLGTARTSRSELTREQVFGNGDQRTGRFALPSRQDPSTGLTEFTLRPLLGNLAGTLEKVRNEQELLRSEIAAQSSELKAAVPEFAKPVLAVARPKYLVLGYPLLIAGVAVYLMLSYTFLKDNIRQWREQQKPRVVMLEVLDVGLAEPHGLVLGMLVGVPLLILALLRRYNDWPQLLDGDWQWAFLAAVVAVVAAAAGCVVYLNRSRLSFISRQDRTKRVEPVSPLARPTGQ